MSTETHVLDDLFDKVLPALDRYMLAKLKFAQVITKTGKAPIELANEVSTAHDILTEEWMAANSNIFKTATQQTDNQ